MENLLCSLLILRKFCWISVVFTQKYLVLEISHLPADVFSRNTLVVAPWRGFYSSCLPSLMSRGAILTVFTYIYFRFQTKIQTWTEIRNSDLQISSLGLYNLSYPASIDSTGPDLSPESNAMHGVVVLLHYCLLIDKGRCENRNVSINFPCALSVYLCMISGELLFFMFTLFVHILWQLNSTRTLIIFGNILWSTKTYFYEIGKSQVSWVHNWFIFCFFQCASRICRFQMICKVLHIQFNN